MGAVTPQRLGDFEIVRELGRGGMGVVFEARQVSLNRKVALKVLSAGLALTSKAIQRFHRESEAAAKLHHTNIVPIYTTGEADGTHFYAMEMIDGPSLDHVIGRMLKSSNGTERIDASDQSAHRSAQSAPPTKGGEMVVTSPYVDNPNTSTDAAPLTSSSLTSGSHYFDTVARKIADVADALEYAHQNGVIHRDIKPSNLLLSDAGRLSINDFGLARMLEQPGMTMTGEFVGTPAYMSPEQITAGRAPLNHRTDIYSLGATLYELLTLHRPFTGERRDEVIAQIMHKEPKAPRKVNPKVPVDLETICLKCLEKDPDRRYQTAGELADDLRRYANRFAISARRAGPVQRLVKWVKRRPAFAAILSCLVVAVCVAVGFAYLAHRSDQQRLLEREEARLQLLDEKIRNAYQVASGGDLRRTDDAIKEIEALGASNGQVRLLRGTVAFFRGDNGTAIGELEQAVKLLPESVAARALLARTYSNEGQLSRCTQLLDEMQDLTPSSPEDYIFKGYARSLVTPGGGLDDLNEGLGRRDSPLGRALRAQVQIARAVDTGRRQDIEAALADANLARGMLPDNMLVLVVSLYARVVAAGIYQDEKQVEHYKTAMQQAAQDVKALESFGDFPNASWGWSMWRYHDAAGDRNEALRVVRRSLEKFGSSEDGFLAVVELYQQGRFLEALECLSQVKRHDIMTDIMRPFLLAELADGPRLASEELEKLMRKYSQDSWEGAYCCYVLLFLGKKEQGQKGLQKLRDLGNPSQGYQEFYEAKRRFAGGELSEKDYLAKAGPLRVKQALAHHEIGLFRLAAGDRGGALDHFRKASATRAYWTYECFYSRMFLSRLESDPNWPPWIPLKQRDPNRSKR